MKERRLNFGSKSPNQNSNKGYLDILEDVQNPIQKPISDSESSIINPSDSEIFTRQTFIVSEAHLDKLKDYVFTKSLEFKKDYTQKQAIYDAFELLFESMPEMKKRLF